MRFTKMQSNGNDYVYVNCFLENVENASRAAIRVSDRHFGVGSDGLILIKPSVSADFKMEMYNADGSSGAMCGNGLCCVAKYVYEHGLTDKTKFSVETGSGIKYPELITDKSSGINSDGKGRVIRVRVDMGAPILEPSRIPVIAGESQKPVIGREISMPGISGQDRYKITCVSMGNPHCVVRIDDVDGLDIGRAGPAFENHEYFPDRVNTEFISVTDRSTIKMRVWERGAGETLSCGTGSCAAAVACILNGWTEDKVTVKLRGGDLLIEWDRSKDTVFLTGPAETVFEGEITL